MLGIFMQEVTSLAHYSSVITNQLLWWVALAPTYRIGLENIVARLGTYDGWKDFPPMYHWVNFSWFQNVIQPYGEFVSIFIIQQGPLLSYLRGKRLR